MFKDFSDELEIILNKFKPPVIQYVQNPKTIQQPVVEQYVVEQHVVNQENVGNDNMVQTVQPMQQVQQPQQEQGSAENNTENNN